MVIQSCSASSVGHNPNIVPLIIHGYHSVFVGEIDHHQAGVARDASVFRLEEVTFRAGAYVIAFGVRAQLVAVTPFRAFISIDASFVIDVQFFTLRAVASSARY